MAYKFITLGNLSEFKTKCDSTYQPKGSYALKSEIPDTSDMATETWVGEQGYLTEHQDLSNYATKDEIPDVSDVVRSSSVTTFELVSSEPSTKTPGVVYLVFG